MTPAILCISFLESRKGKNRGGWEDPPLKGHRLPSCSPPPPARLCTHCPSASGGSKALLALAGGSGPGPGELGRGGTEAGNSPSRMWNWSAVLQNPAEKSRHGGESQISDSSGFSSSAHKHQRPRLAPDQALLGWNGFGGPAIDGPKEWVLPFRNKGKHSAAAQELPQSGTAQGVPAFPHKCKELRAP